MKNQHTCLVCNRIFIKYICNARLKSGRGKTCSIKCRSKLQKLKPNNQIIRKCERCGKDYKTRLSEDRRGYIRKYCSNKCWQPVERGKAISVDGYYVINNKKIHRLIYEENTGKKLTSKDIIHHINFNKLDNRIENLQLVTRGQHNQIHNFLHKKYPA